MRYISGILLLCIMICEGKASAQDSANRYPCTVLLQISSEHNRIVALGRGHRTKDLEVARKDAAMVQQSMLADFKENFSYCPVYYFMDTNADLVREQHFSGVLHKLDSTLLVNTPSCLDSGRYLVLYYGTAATQLRKKALSDDEENTYGSPAGRGLVILNDDFQQVSYIYKLGTAELFGEAKKKKNYYSSPRFDIEYYPLAGRLDQRLRQRRDQTSKIRISK